VVEAYSVADDGTVDGTQVPGRITAVVDGMETITLEGTDDGTCDQAITTGLLGNDETTIYYDDGAVGIEFGVTNGTVITSETETVGTETIDDEATELGTHEVATITAVVCGIVTTDEAGILVGNDSAGMITGLDGKEVSTTMYEDLGKDEGIDPGVTIGVVNKIE